MRAGDVVDCHVLVIGSGGAGVRAAIEAARYGETVLVSKTIAGKGGCTPMAEGGYNAVLRQEDSCEIHYEDTLRGGAFLNEPDLVRILVKESPQRIDDLIRWGAVFDFSNECELAQRPFGGQRFPRTCYAGDRTGHEMMMTLIERFDSSGATKMEEVTVIDLLKEGDRVIGAFALDENGDPIVITADSTILATGGGARVYDISTNSSSGTGDGFAMGYRAGAELIDMEMVQFHPTGAVYPYDARGRLITEAVRGEGGVLKNALGERFMKRYDPVRMELSTRDVVSRAIATEIANGRGTPHGGVFLDITHLPREQIETRLPVMLEQFLTFGVDIRNTADGGRSHRPPHHGWPEDHFGLFDNRAGSLCLRRNLRRRAGCKPAGGKCSCRDPSLREARRRVCRPERETGKKDRSSTGVTGSGTYRKFLLRDRKPGAGPEGTPVCDVAGRGYFPGRTRA